MYHTIKVFIFKIFLIGLFTLGTIEIFYQFNPYTERNLEISYTASIIEKYKRLQSLRSPKIVLIAGSNFAYGINSEMIEKSFQKPVVNMAMHYDYGTDFMLKQIQNELKAGDIVIMGFEYIIEAEGNMGEKIQMAKLFPKANEWFDYKDIVQYIRENAIVRISSLRLTLERLSSREEAHPTVDDTTSIFFRNAINEYGDLVSHLNNPPLKTIPPAVINDKVSMHLAIADMNAFYEKMQKRGVKVYYSYPSYAQSSYEHDKVIINKLNTELKKEARFPILGELQEFVFADSLCQDMVYHLNAKGRDIRTQKLIDLLKNAH
ncbi:hypothetical protein [Emticicia agri]|uniref:SGNH/GDSL hydrolase family protein n=1 Tax=Emticicia agri TaxID=2492393 RepID=A0A4Q5LVE8_9BACT|nr:hypothetical protein [Emticicia agri]RYU93525.1 hypothetical protein EWM59_21710 [Emticicia agri]